MDSRPREADAPAEPSGGSAPAAAANGEVEITKPRNDKRGYRRVVLPNDLECLLVSDPDTDKVLPASLAALYLDRDGEGGLVISWGFWLWLESCDYLFCLQAAASMNVSVGYFCDPEGLEGLAHFLGEFFLLRVVA